MPVPFMTTTLRLADPKDLSAINARYARIDFVPSGVEDLVVLALRDGTVAGQGRIVPLDARSAELGGIHVLPEFGGAGIATAIVDFLLKRTQVPKLYCIPFAELAPFYGSMGFVPVTDRTDVPPQVLEKLRWCEGQYGRPVLLMVRTAILA